MSGVLHGIMLAGKSQNYSVQFDGTSYLSIADHAALDLPGSFTLEFWLNVTSSTPNGAGIVGHRAFGGWNGDGTDWVIRAQVDDGKVGFGYSVSGAYYDMGALTTGQWVHYAFVRQNTTFYTFRNGSQVATGTNSSSWSSPSAFVIGENGGNDLLLNGSISNLRLVKDSALYTANFTPSTKGLTAISGTSLLVCHASSLVDGSSNNFTITTVRGTPSISTNSPFS